MDLKDMMVNSYITDIFDGKTIDDINVDQWVKDLIPEARKLAETARLNNIKARITKKVNQLGHTYDQWYDWATSLYTITSEFKVISSARDWDEEMSWEMPDAPSALEKVEQLVGYKIYDRNRGRGNMDKDMEIS